MWPKAGDVVATSDASSVTITDIRVPFVSLFVLVLKVTAAMILVAILVYGTFFSLMLAGCATLMGAIGATSK